MSAEVMASEADSAVDSAHSEPVTVTRPRIFRFARVTRIFHWVNAAAVIVLIATGAVIWIAPLSKVIGRRELIRDLHVWTGIAITVFLLVILTLPWGKSVRDDLRRVERFDRDDRRWLMRATGASGESPPQGKFNAGQKLNAIWSAAAMILFIVTGISMRWYYAFPEWWIQGCNTVHDLAFIVITVTVILHIVIALFHPVELRSMLTGWAPANWALDHHSKWASTRSRDEAK